MTTLTGTLETTRRGKRYVVCPKCCVLSAGIALQVTRLTCHACGADIDITTRPARRKAKVCDMTYQIAT
jgi:hypothetical protein